MTDSTRPATTIPANALPDRIGRVSLGASRSDGECLCSHGHAVPQNHPLYWPERMGEYPDDMDPLCLAHAIEQSESDQGWCEHCVADETEADKNTPKPATTDRSDGDVLLPCPFCGGAAEVQIDRGRNAVGIGCTKCTTSMVPSWDIASEVWARRAWNTRTTHAADVEDRIRAWRTSFDDMHRRAMDAEAKLHAADVVQESGADGQDRKFAFRDGQFVNRVSGEPIPAEEPVIIFRARDRHAHTLLALYRDMATDEHHQQAITDRMDEFAAFARAYPERMKEPGITRHIQLNDPLAIRARGNAGAGEG